MDDMETQPMLESMTFDEVPELDPEDMCHGTIKIIMFCGHPRVQVFQRLNIVYPVTVI